MKLSLHLHQPRRLRRDAFGLQVRGRSAKVIGGVYEGINPLHIEPSTTQKTVISGAVFFKWPATDTDVARQAGLKVYGLEVLGGWQGTRGF